MILSVNIALGETSRKRLDTCDARLQQIVNAACREAPFEFMVVYGFRDQAMQDAAYAKGNSKLKWPNSKHNKQPALAVDLAPYIDKQIPWNDIPKWEALGAHVKAVSERLHIPITWGGDWEMRDYGHFELKESS